MAFNGLHKHRGVPELTSVLKITLRRIIEVCNKIFEALNYVQN